MPRRSALPTFAGAPDPETPRVLAESDGLLVVDKRAGRASTGRDLSDPSCLQADLMRTRRRRIWAVHQLDAETSGVMLFVQRKALVAEYADRLARTESRKVYLAICHGAATFEKRDVDAPIGFVDDGIRKGWAVTPSGREARSRVEIVARGRAHCAAHVEIATGRSHQVRIHLAHLGLPVVGERRYRDPPCEEHARHALHALRIELAGDPPLTFESPPPADLVELWGALGLTPPLGG